MTNEDMTRSRELFAEVDEYNWDDGIGRMGEILNDPACDRATALMMFWRTDPVFYFRKAMEGAAFEDYEQPTYDLLQSIVRKMGEGNLMVGPNSYAPADDWTFDRMDPATQQIPDVMFESVVGVAEE